MNKSFWPQTIGILVIIVGVLLLLDAVGVRVGNVLGVLFAALVIILGVGMLLGGRRGRWWGYRRD